MDAMTPEGLIVCGSKFGPKETMNRLAAAETIRGISIMARIDHAAAAAVTSMEFRPTEVLIFGNPRAATLLMQAAQTVGMDLPLKALVGQYRDGTTCLAYNDPQWLAHRHAVDSALDRTRSPHPITPPRPIEAARSAAHLIRRKIWSSGLSPSYPNILDWAALVRRAPPFQYRQHISPSTQRC